MEGIAHAVFASWLHGGVYMRDAAWFGAAWHGAAWYDGNSGTVTGKR